MNTLFYHVRVVNGCWAFKSQFLCPQTAVVI
jgi:hypothetical protein